MHHHGAQDPSFITIVGILGNIISGLVYLAPLPTYRRIYKKKSTEGFQSVPYVTALFSAMLWLYYALLKQKEYFIVSINSVGCIIETLYIAFYYVYASRNARIYAATLVISLNVVVFSVIVLIIQLLDSRYRVQVLGIICAVVSTSVFAAPLAIIVKVIRTKSVEFMPFPLSFFLTLCAIIWFLYGILRRDIFIYIPNVFGFALGLLQMILYVVCKNCCISKDSDQSNSNTNNTVNGNTSTVDHHPHHHQTESEQVNHQTSDQQDSKNEVRTELQLPIVALAV